jgi:hypothetical protein
MYNGVDSRQSCRVMCMTGRGLAVGSPVMPNISDGGGCRQSCHRQDFPAISHLPPPPPGPLGEGGGEKKVLIKAFFKRNLKERTRYYCNLPIQPEEKTF